MGCCSNTPIKKHIPSQFLLITLILAQFLVSMVCAGHITPHYSEGDGNDSTGIVRETRLYSQSTNKYVRIHRRNGKTVIDAKGGKGADSLLKFTSVGFGKNGTIHFTIQSNKTGEYLCFSSHGRLVAKRLNEGRRRRPRKMCIFNEVHKTSYSMYQSLKNSNYFLGFDWRDKEAMKGREWKKRERWNPRTPGERKRKEKWLECRRFLSPNKTLQDQADGDTEKKSDYQPFTFSKILKHNT